jgi:hypothetical protein
MNLFKLSMDALVPGAPLLNLYLLIHLNLLLRDESWKA